MFERTVEYYRLINRQGEAEESVAFRLAVLVTVLISVIAALIYGQLGVVTGVLVITGVLAGSIFSYFTRRKANLLLKAILSVLLLVVFVIFWADLGGSIHDLRYPLVRLFLWLQVLHSFDLPTRRDLDFSLVSAAVLIAFAGSLSISGDFIYLLVPFFVSGLVALYLGNRSSLQSKSAVFEKARGGRVSPAGALVLAGIILVPLALGVFMLLPRLPGFNTYYLPMSRSTGIPRDFSSLIRNPGYQSLQEFPDKPLPYRGDAYYGFNSFLDLRTRGVPSDTLVMKVRCNEPEYWRAYAFDRFLGNGWENTEKEREDITGNGLPLTVTYPGEVMRYGTRDVMQTFFIEEQLPNTLFAAYIPRDVYFPTAFLKVDSMMSVLTPVTLDPGLIYTVLSEVTDVRPEALRMAPTNQPGRIVEKYCQLPQDMSPEVAALTAEVTVGADTEYDKTEAISEYLRSTYPYDLEVGRQADDENTVEFFLFKAKRGYCEHFATAMAVMCRTQGIPARVAVGYATGEYNSLTGYYEVSAKDAHAWVEVYYPAFGWVSYDPTPGWTDPFRRQGTDSTWSGFNLVKNVGTWVGKVFPDSWGRSLRSAGRTLSAAVEATGRGIRSAWRAAWLEILAAAALIVAVALFVRYLRRRKKRPASPHGPPTPPQRAAGAFERMASLLALVGIEWTPAQTACELGAQADAALRFDLGSRAAELFNRLRFARAASHQDADMLDEVVDRMETAIKG